MSYQGRGNSTILIFAGLGFGVLIGALIGLLLARGSGSKPFTDVVESVQELRNRAEQVLSELSASVSSLERFEGDTQHEALNKRSASLVGRNGPEEAMG